MSSVSSVFTAFMSLALPVALVLLADRPVRGDVNGPWRFGLFASQGAVLFSDTCSVVVEQSGTALSIRGSCQGAANPLNVAGTIDPVSGRFSAVGSAGICSAITVEGALPGTADAFAATFACPPHASAVNVIAGRCGNGQLDPGETCDDGNLIDRDCCTSGCFLHRSGDACTDDGNQCTVDTCDAAGQCQHAIRTGLCDDGNSCTTGDACVDGQCVAAERPNGVGCNDGNPCTEGDTCRGGVCIATPMECPPCESCNARLGCVPTITNACKQAPAHSLVLQDRRSNTVQWRWLRGDATQLAELGSPTSGTEYDFCIYDSSFDANGTPRLLLGARAPAGSEWHPTTSGFAYDNQTLTLSGLRRMLLRAGAQGRSAVMVKGQGPGLTFPPLQSVAFPLTVQVKDPAGQQGTCWSAAYGRAAMTRPEAIRATLARRGPETRPNIVVVNLDDTRADGIDRMPTLLSRIAGQGTSFANSFAVNPLCAPSRASLVTGLSARHHGTRTLGGLIGGAHLFRELHADQQTVATWLQQAGYMTGMFGKYINGYGYLAESTEGANGTFYVPPGWTRWRAMATPEHFGGVRGETYALIDERGIATVYDDHRTDAQYSTDVLGAELRRFIADSVGQGRPFFALWAPYASHAEIPSLRPEPAARHYQFHRSIPAWRPLNFNESDVSDKPRHVQDLMFGSFELIIFTDVIRQRAYESLLAVDENLSMLLDDLVQLGVDDNTVIIVTSDNGVSWGEHRLFGQSKECPYEECLRVPMIVRDPRVGRTAVVRDAAVLNTDVASTVADLAGVIPPVATDGTSFAPWLGSEPPAQWRDDFLLEHWRSVRDDRLDYTDNMSDGDQVRLLYGDAQPRASVLFEFDDGSGVADGAVAVPIGNDADATFAQLRAQVVALPSVRATHFPSLDVLNAIDDSPDHLGVYWIIERDQGEAINHRYGLGDYYGVRDVRAGLTYVEHESGEVELYDLTVDPAQLENKANDPAYAGTRERLANRLDELLR